MSSGNSNRSPSGPTGVGFSGRRLASTAPVQVTWLQLWLQFTLAQHRLRRATDAADLRRWMTVDNRGLNIPSS